MKPGNKPKAPKATLYGSASQSQPCLADEYMATSKGNVLVANNQNQAQANEAKPLALLQADDMLYIVGHGSALGASLTYKRPPPASHRVKDGAIAADKQLGCGNRARRCLVWLIGSDVRSVLGSSHRSAEPSATLKNQSG